MLKTHEGAQAYEHSLNHALEFFSKAGSAFTGRREFYSGSESALSLFQKIWIVDKELSMRLLFWLRDCRGGAGNRSGARECYKWLANVYPEWLDNNVNQLPELGRWDDLRSLFDSQSEYEAVKLWTDAIINGDVLAAKWADRNDRPLRLHMEMTIGDFRRYLARLRKNHIVEHKMCTNQWDSIEYKTVPSVAMARYTNAFKKNDMEHFNKFKEKVKTGEEKIHAEVLFPHDCVRTVKNGDDEIADAQFKALPNFMEGTDERIMVISDTSASMESCVSGSVEAIDVSQGLALYCSSRMPKQSPYYKRFIGFCSESSFKDWNGLTFSEAVRNRRIFDGAIDSTRIDKALDLMLSIAKDKELSNDEIPTTLLIVSDMQFHQGGCSRDYWYENNEEFDDSLTEIERSLKRWDKSGFTRPKIVYWNTSSYRGQQETSKSNNVGLVSGFSPSILKAVFGGEDFSPITIMMRAIEKYKVNVPD